jgi:hypothetical protein
MGEQSNDRTIHEILTHIIEIENKMRAQRDAHTQRKQPAGEADAQANRILAQLSAKLEELIEEDAAIDHEVDAILKRVRRDVIRIVREHRQEDKEDLVLKKLALDLRDRVEQDRDERPGKGSITLGAVQTLDLARKMITILEQKDATVQHDDDLARRVRRLLKKAIEDFE